MKLSGFTLISVAVMVLATSCTTPGLQFKKDLKKIDKQRTVTVNKDYRYFRKFPFGNSVYYGVKACKYVSTFRNHFGTYYLGTGKCVISHSIKHNKTTYLPGGIWIPDNPSQQKPRMFVIIQGYMKDGTLIAYLNNREVGNYRRLREIKDEKFNRYVLSIFK